MLEGANANAPAVWQTRVCVRRRVGSLGLMDACCRRVRYHGMHSRNDASGWFKHDFNIPTSSGPESHLRLDTTGVSPGRRGFVFAELVCPRTVMLMPPSRS